MCMGIFKNKNKDPKKAKNPVHQKAYIPVLHEELQMLKIWQDKGLGLGGNKLWDSN